MLRISQPGGQLVKDEWKMDITSFLAVSMGMVVLEVDGRGSGGRGEDRMKMLVRKVGVGDVEDQMAALE